MQFSAHIENGKLTIDTPKKWREFLETHGEGTALVLDVERKRSKRSVAQNSALHLYFELLARELNNAGYSVQLVMKERIETDWNKEMVKELLWRPLQVAVLKKKSTTELNKSSDIDEVYEHLNRFVGEKFGLHIPFPNIEQAGGISNYGSF